MKRKILIIFLALVCAFCLAFGIAACNNGTTNGGTTNTEQSGGTTDDGTTGGTTDDGTTDDGEQSGGNTDGDQQGDQQGDEQGDQQGDQQGDEQGDEQGDQQGDQQGDEQGDEQGDQQGDEQGDITHTHISGEAVIENQVDATCTQTGSYDSVVYCSECGEEISRETITIPMLEHTYSGYIYNENGHWQECSVCGNTTASESHTFENNICTVCGYEYIAASVGLDYTISDDGTYYTVSGIGTCTDTDLVIPETYNGKSVSAIAESAFANQTQLISVYVPDSVTSIGDRAFYNCTALTSINVDSGNTAYKSIDGNLYSYDGTIIVQYALGKSEANFSVPVGVITIGNYAFSCATKVKCVELPATLTTINYCAFYYSGIVSMIIPEGVTTLGDRAFDQCYSLVSLTIPSTITGNTDGDTVIEGLVEYCCSLIEVYNLASSVKFISRLDSIKELTEADILSRWGGYFQIYSKNVYTSVDVESCIITQGDYLFYKDGNDYYIAGYKGGDTELVLPDLFIDGNIVNYGISDYMFYYCLWLESITIPDSVTSIGNYAFQYCHALKSITIPDSVTSIGDVAFQYCTALESIIIPDSVTFIGYRAFGGCSKLTSVTFENTSGWYIESLLVPTSSTTITSDDLSNTSTAAGYLTSTYCGYYWYRK